MLHQGSDRLTGGPAMISNHRDKTRWDDEIPAGQGRRHHRGERSQQDGVGGLQGCQGWKRLADVTQLGVEVVLDDPAVGTCCPGGQLDSTRCRQAPAIGVLVTWGHQDGVQPLLRQLIGEQTVLVGGQVDGAMPQCGRHLAQARVSRRLDTDGLGTSCNMQ